MDRPIVRVQTVVKPGEVQLLEGWIECLAASARQATGRELVGGVEVAIADASGSGASLQLGDEGGQWCTRWTVHPVPSDEGVCRAHNVLFGSPDPVPDFVLLADLSACLAPSCLSALLSSMNDSGVGVAEPRQLPLESLKSYDLGSGDTGWASGRCCLIRWRALAGAGGFDVDTFPAEGADVDLSWRLRASGWSIRYVPWAAFLDRFEPARSDAPFGGDGGRAELAKLLLGSKYGGPTLAAAWAAAWTIRGTDPQRVAAGEFQGRRTAGTLPAEAVDTSVDLVPELFALGSLDWPSYDETPGTPARTPPGRPGPTTGGSQPFLSVIVRTQGRRLAALEENLLSLTAQTCQDFEVVLVGHDLGPTAPAVASLVETFPAAFVRRVRLSEVAGGGRSRPLNVAVGQARGRYLAFLDDDDVAFSDWVEAFRRVAEEQGGVVWTEVAVQAVDQVSCAGRETWRVREPPASFAARFDLLAHLRRNETPNCGLAIPATVFQDHGIGFREDLNVLEDWDLLLRAVQVAAVHETGCVSALYRRGMSGDTASVTTNADWDAAEAEVLGAFDRSAFVLRGEYLPVLRDALDELDLLHEQAPGVTTQLRGNGSTETSLAGRVAILSPHLDDAVLSCGDLIWQIPHCTVLTIFAGSDVEWSELRDWDRLAGFRAGEDVVARRIEEDDEALAVLGAAGLRLSFLDEQYRDPGVIPPVEALSREIQDALEALHAEVAFMPLGLRHGDHKLVASAAQHAARTRRPVRWYAYQDLPYASEQEPGIDEALADLADLDPTEVVLGLGHDAERKDRALDCYRSQLLALGGDRRSDALLPERYWALTTPRS